MTVQRTKQPQNNTHNTSVLWDVTPYRWEKFTAVWKNIMRPRKNSKLLHISPDGNVKQSFIAPLNTRCFTVRYWLRPKTHLSMTMKPQNEVCCL